MISFPRALALIAIVSGVFTSEEVHAFSSAKDLVKFSQHQHNILLKNNNYHNKNRYYHLSQRKTRSSTLMAEKRNNANPFKNLIGDMASSILSNVGGNSDISVINDDLDKKLNEISTLPSWDAIRKKLESLQTDEEKAFRSNVDKGIGKPSPLNKIRLFDESNKEEDIRVTLYRDSASWCPYCQKVWMTLEEKRIPYRIEKVNMRCYGEKPASFMRLQPSGNIPVAIIDGTLYNQSNDIMYALEEFFPNNKKLLPPTENEQLRIKAQSLLRLERTLFSAWMYWLTGSERSKGSFIKTLKEVDSELSSAMGGDFFLGKDVSLVDFMFAPFLERMCASLLFFKGFQIRVAPGVNTEFPAVNKWFDAMETLESYQLTKSDYYTHNWDLPPQLGGCTYEVGCEAYEKAINGERTIDGSRGSWELPLQPDLGGVEPDWKWCGDEDAAKREAVERLSFNHVNIVSFAARGAGKKGIPSYMAALSDPNATPSETVKGSIDACLRAISISMIESDDDASSKIMQEVVNTILTVGGKEFVNSVISSLVYLRDRVGVPRDMRLPAARQLRARLNWAIEKML